LFGIGSQELLILFLVVLLLFGADRIPEVARAVGKSIRDFKRAAGEIETEIQQVTRHKDILSEKKLMGGGGKSSGSKSEPPVKGAGGDELGGAGPEPDGGGKRDASEVDGSGKHDADEDAPEAKYPGEETPQRP
jgi:sec-independent protein translocase protein TatA